MKLRWSAAEENENEEREGRDIKGERGSGIEMHLDVIELIEIDIIELHAISFQLAQSQAVADQCFIFLGILAHW